MLALTEVDMLKLLPNAWSTLTNKVFGLMYLFPEGSNALLTRPGRSGGGIRGSELGSDLAPQRIIGRDDICQPRDRQSCGRIKAIAITNWNAVYGPRGSGIENLSRENRPSQKHRLRSASWYSEERI